MMDTGCVFKQAQSMNYPSMGNKKGYNQTKQNTL